MTRPFGLKQLVALKDMGCFISLDVPMLNLILFLSMSEMKHVEKLGAEYPLC